MVNISVHVFTIHKTLIMFENIIGLSRQDTTEEAITLQNKTNKHKTLQHTFSLPKTNRDSILIDSRSGCHHEGENYVPSLLKLPLISLVAIHQWLSTGDTAARGGSTSC